jgi:hypothetical protein
MQYTKEIINKLTTRLNILNNIWNDQVIDHKLFKQKQILNLFKLRQMVRRRKILRNRLRKRKLLKQQLLRNKLINIMRKSFLY